MALSYWFEPQSRLLSPRRNRGFFYDPEDFWLLPRIAREHDRLMQWPSFYKQLNNLSLSDEAVKFDKDKFQVNLDVQQFTPEEISVTASGDTVTVEAKHEEKQDEHGFISRHFIRKFTIPKDHDISGVQSKLSSDGVLTITAPKVSKDGEENQRIIPITQTGQPTPTKNVSEKPTGDGDKNEQSKL